MTDALQMQLEVQKRLHEQLEVGLLHNVLSEASVLHIVLERID